MFYTAAGGSGSRTSLWTYPIPIIAVLIAQGVTVALFVLNRRREEKRRFERDLRALCGAVSAAAMRVYREAGVQNHDVTDGSVYDLEAALALLDYIVTADLYQKAFGMVTHVDYLWGLDKSQIIEISHHKDELLKSVWEFRNAVRNKFDLPNLPLAVFEKAQY